MRTNIDIDDKLIAKVMKATNTKTKKDAVRLSLQETLKRHTRPNLLDLMGSNLITDDYDYKAARTNGHAESQ
jgi:Arc/MetJ family transcription regulator